MLAELALAAHAVELKAPAAADDDGQKVTAVGEMAGPAVKAGRRPVDAPDADGSETPGDDRQLRPAGERLTKSSCMLSFMKPSCPRTTAPGASGLLETRMVRGI